MAGVTMLGQWFESRCMMCHEDEDFCNKGWQILHLGCITIEAEFCKRGYTGREK